MTLACSHIHVPRRLGLPTRQLVAVCDCLVKNVNGASPNVEIVETRLLPANARKDVVRQDSRVNLGHAVPNIDSMAHCHRPESSVGNVWPVGGRMKQHTTRHGHYCLY